MVSEIRAAALASGKPLSAVFDAVTVGTGWAEPPGASEVDLTKSSPAIAKQCLSDGVSGKDTKLCASLLVEFDRDWTFCLCYRDKSEEASFHGRLEVATPWIFAHAQDIGYTVPKVRVVKGAEEGVKMIKDVFGGKMSMEKVVIEHPM